jgi:hypothetical protein
MSDGVRDLYLQKEELWVEMASQILAEQYNFHVIVGFFNMLQSCDMGQTAVFLLRRKAC